MLSESLALDGGVSDKYTSSLAFGAGPSKKRRSGRESEVPQARRANPPIEAKIPHSASAGNNVLTEGGYQLLANGHVRCKPCKKNFHGIAGYNAHLTEAAQHDGTRGLRAKKVIPPALARSATPPSGNLAASSADPEEASESVPIGNPTANIAAQALIPIIDPFLPAAKHCRLCDLTFRTTSELHRHFSEDTIAHPYYCPDCVLEFPGETALLAVRALICALPSVLTTRAALRQPELLSTPSIAFVRASRFDSAGSSTRRWTKRSEQPRRSSRKATD